MRKKKIEKKLSSQKMIRNKNRLPDIEKKKKKNIVVEIGLAKE